MTRPIYDYPSDWEVFELSSKPNDVILNVSQGSDPSSNNPDYWNGTIPFLTGKEITHRFTPIYVSTSERYITKKGASKIGGIKNANSVIFSTRAPVGSVVINKIPMGVSRSFLSFKCGSQLLPEFLYFWFRANRPYLDRVANSTTFDSLNEYNLFEFKIGIPKINEQQKIVDFLKSIDDKIQNNLKIKKNLTSSLFSIYRNWFCDDENYSKEWEKVKFNVLATTQAGFSYKGIEKSNDKTHHSFVTLKNINMDGGFKTQFSWINSTRLKERHFVNELDLVIANTHFGVGGAEFGRLLATPALIIFPNSYSKSNAVFSMDVSKIILKKNNIKYFLYFLFFDKHLEFASKYHTGTGVQHLDYKNFETEYEIILPPNSLLEKFDKICDLTFKKVLSSEKQILILENIRDSLERKLVYGKIRLE